MVDETFHHRRSSERIRRARGLFCLSCTRCPPRTPGPGYPRVPLSPVNPLYCRPLARVLLFSHHGRRTAVRELLLFVGRRPAQTAGFSMISNPFRCAYTRATTVLNWPRWNKVHGLCPLNGISARARARKKLGIRNDHFDTALDADGCADTANVPTPSLLFRYFHVDINYTARNDIDALWQLLISNILTGKLLKVQSSISFWHKLFKFNPNGFFSRSWNDMLLGIINRLKTYSAMSVSFLIQSQTYSLDLKNFIKILIYCHFL